PRERQLLAELTLDGHVRPPFERRLPRLVLGRRPADVDLTVRGLARTTCPLEGSDRVLLRRRGDQAVSQRAGHLRCALTRGGDHDRRWLVGPGVDRRLLDGVVPPPVRLLASSPERPHHTDRLFHHVKSLVDSRPP